MRIPAGDLRTIARARAFALAGVRKARLIRWATGLHAACALPLAAGLAYPFTGVMWSPLAALALLVSLCALSLTSAARLGPVFS